MGWISNCCSAGVTNDEGDDELGQCLDCGKWCECMEETDEGADEYRREQVIALRGLI